MKSFKFGLSTKITACILTVQIVVMAAMVLFIGNAITNNTRRSTTNNMETVVEERSRIIEKINKAQKDKQHMYSLRRSSQLQIFRCVHITCSNHRNQESEKSEVKGDAVNMGCPNSLIDLQLNTHTQTH